MRPVGTDSVLRAAWYQRGGPTRLSSCFRAGTEQAQSGVRGVEMSANGTGLRITYQKFGEVLAYKEL